MLTDIMLIIIKFTGAYFLETKYSNTTFFAMIGVFFSENKTSSEDSCLIIYSFWDEMSPSR